jgi:hypothetical protein
VNLNPKELGEEYNKHQNLVQCNSRCNHQSKKNIRKITSRKLYTNYRRQEKQGYFKTTHSYIYVDGWECILSINLRTYIKWINSFKLYFTKTYTRKNKKT